MAAATVMLLSPNDSTVVTYGFTDGYGRFSIPCDLERVIGKFSCIGYKTVYRDFTSFSTGTITMPLRAVNLGEVRVEGENARLYADKSVFLPTARQKNMSQSGADLLSQMAIPYLGISTSSIVTNTGKPVAVFIDYIPASDDDLRAMRVADVKKVEYYENPSDPRLQGNPFVINFIMQKYITGGYFKAFENTNFISNRLTQGFANLRLQYKRMTYDIMGAAYYSDRRDEGSETAETFRLPQESGEIKEFHRYSSLTSSKETRSWYYTSARATYNSENVQASTQITGRIEAMPHATRAGMVTFSPGIYPESAYTSERDERSKYLAYNGYYFISLPNGNSVTFNPSYSFSHTAENSLYAQDGYAPIYNGATDNTNKLAGTLKFRHDFGKYGNLLGIVKGSYEYNRTSYTGSAMVLDRAKSARIAVAAEYDVTIADFYGKIGVGLNKDRLQFGEMVDRPSSPAFNISMQYAPDTRHSLSARFEYESWLPSPNFKSDKIIEASPLLSYTGNPNLVPGESYDFDFSYTWIPDNNYSLAAFAWAWVVGDRYAYDYEATSEGVLRTVKQPMGTFAQGMYGINGTMRFLDKTLIFTGNLSQILNHNGKPYDINHSYILWHIRGRYYIRQWCFTLTYVSDTASSDGCMNGIWHYGKSYWYPTIVWSNDKWNVRCDLFNFSRWHRRSAVRVMHSQYYDTRETVLGGASRAYIQLSATFTFGFGKKVQHADQPSLSGSASSGILK